MPTRSVLPKEPTMLVHSHREGASVRPVAPPVPVAPVTLKLGLVHLDF